MEPLVSVVCITYNHEKYIAEAIESFLMQETDFPFEIIIHDDASTDRTPEIIREYENKYPDIIKPIYQKENQFSKGVKGNIRTIKFIAPLIQGNYVAVCEGDDYWIDKEKLQKQVNFLEKNEEYIACFHRVKVVNIEGNFTGKYLEPKEFGSRDYTIKDVVKDGFMHVSSRMYRSEFYKREQPNWVNISYHGDSASALYLTIEGKVFFLEKTMSAYRIGVENSIMTNLRTKFNKEEIIENYVNMLEVYTLANEYYNYKYKEDINIILNNVSDKIVSIIEDPDKNTNKTNEELIKLIPLKYKDILKESFKRVEHKKNYIRFIEDFKDGLYDNKIMKYFNKENKLKLIIYGAGTLGMILKEKLKKTNSEVLFFIEDRYFSDPHNNIFSINDIKKNIIADEIIVTPFYDYENIKELLLGKGITLPVNALDKILL